MSARQLLVLAAVRSLRGVQEHHEHTLRVGGGWGVSPQCQTSVVEGLVLVGVPRPMPLPIATAYSPLGAWFC